ncbi:Rcs stress response system protein RcsF [Succinivibrio sp.]|uniref:Rcs stress response system protein RcsF n=1 Tax=Succinivibrio sp. TaxID=2053619 RepID=UPI00386FC7DF
MKYFVALSALLLASCSSFEFKTNLDPSNFTEYFKPSSVEEVTEEELVSKPYRTVKTVEGLSCQEDEKDAVATEADARTKARIKAADAGANAIRFDKCVHLKNTKACRVSITCYADALIVDDK